MNETLQNRSQRYILQVGHWQPDKDPIGEGLLLATLQSTDQQGQGKQQMGNSMDRCSDGPENKMRFSDGLLGDRYLECRCM